MPQYISTRIPNLYGKNAEDKRQEIKSYFNTTYELYESLFDLLGDQSAFYYRANNLRHPLIFYYGHTATFFINKLKFAKVITQRVDAKLESIFAVGVDEMSWDDLNEEHYAWPTREQTKHYRDSVKEIVNKLIDTLPLSLPIADDTPWWVILMAIEHENIHLETSSVLIRELPLSKVVSSDKWSISKEFSEARANKLLNVPNGKVALGKDQHAQLYGWDNEYGSHTVDIPSFEASQYLVSCGEFLPFIEEGGYLEDRFWSQEGWEWREYTQSTHPTFWVKKQHSYMLRTLTEEIVLPMNWPVEVNFHEAMAFCSWLSQKSNKRITLPTEDEYMRLLDYCNVPDISDWGQQAPANINLEFVASSTPVDHFSFGDFYDVIGNVWQWSSTQIYPYEGFRVDPIYDDFTVPTFDGKHNLIKGGSWISRGNLASSRSRYAFRRHFFQHAGFRYVQSSYKEPSRESGYESDKFISQYCHFDWGDRYFGVDNYPANCAKIAIDAMGDRAKRRALDLGCTVGRSSFELARAFEEVVGVDFSARFIQNAQKLKDNGMLLYTLPTQGDLKEFCEIKLSEYGLENFTDRVSFWQGDACNLKPIFSGFDLIFAGNLLDRLYEPQKFLYSLASRLNSGGLLILTSPYNWQEETTPKEQWIGGFKRDGENFTTLDGLVEILGGDFTLKDTRDIPLVIRETERRYQHTIAQMSIWELKY